MLGSAATDRQAQDDERRVDGQLLDLLGVALAGRDHPEVATVELLAEGLHRRLDRCRVVGRPLSERRVSGLVHADKLRHAEPPRSGSNPSYAPMSSGRRTRPRHQNEPRRPTMPQHATATREEWQAARNELAKLESEH